MRILVVCYFWMLSWGAFAEILVVAGCEWEHQIRAAERLIGLTREKNWNRDRWEARCRQEGFEVVGSEQVAYLIPLQYTPRFVDDPLIPFLEYLLQQEVPVCRLDMLPASLQQVPIALLQGLSAVSFTSPESLYSKLRAGTMAVGLSVTWFFEAEPPLQDTASEPIKVFAFWSGNRVYSRDILKMIRTDQNPRGTFTDSSLRKWHFVCSHQLPLAQQSEHLKAYLEWIVALQKQLQSMMPEIRQRIQALLFPEPINLQLGTVYSLSELESILPQGSKIVSTSSELPVQSVVYRGLKLGLEAHERDQQVSGMEGIISISVSLETLLGMKDK